MSKNSVTFNPAVIENQNDSNVIHHLTCKDNCEHINEISLVIPHNIKFDMIVLDQPTLKKKTVPKIMISYDDIIKSPLINTNLYNRQISLMKLFNLPKDTPNRYFMFIITNFVFTDPYKSSPIRIYSLEYTPYIPIIISDNII